MASFVSSESADTIMDIRVTNHIDHVWFNISISVNSTVSNLLDQLSDQRVSSSNERREGWLSSRHWIDCGGENLLTVYPPENLLSTTKLLTCSSLHIYDTESYRNLPVQEEELLTVTEEDVLSDMLEIEVKFHCGTAGVNVNISVHASLQKLLDQILLKLPPNTDMGKSYDTIVEFDGIDLMTVPNNQQSLSETGFTENSKTVYVIFSKQNGFMNDVNASSVASSALNAFGHIMDRAFAVAEGTNKDF